MTNVKKAAEQLRITGKNYDAVIRQVAEKYHAGNGWAIVRTIDRIITMDVYVERSGNYSSEDQEITNGIDDTEHLNSSEKNAERLNESVERIKETVGRKAAPKVAKTTKEVEK